MPLTKTFNKDYFVSPFSPTPRKYKRRRNSCLLRLSICVHILFLNVFNRRALHSYGFPWLSIVYTGHHQNRAKQCPRIFYTPLLLCASLGKDGYFHWHPHHTRWNSCIFLDLKWCWIKNAGQRLMDLNNVTQQFVLGIFYFLWLP